MTAANNPPTRALTDHELLTSLGYKQEFRRAFRPIEVFGVAFSVIGIVPSIASVLFYPISNGGGPAMVWGWAVASFFLLLVAMSLAELASFAPTSGGLYFWTYSLSSPRWRAISCWIVGYANTFGCIASFASVNWGCAVQIMAAAKIGSDGSFSSTSAQTFALYAAISFTHMCLCCLGTTLLARLQTCFIVLNILLCLAIIVAIPIATPPNLKNSAEYALWRLENVSGWPDGYAFLLSLTSPLWTLGSLDASVHISEEASNAATVVPWAMVLAVAAGGILGFAINMSLAFCMGTDLQTLYSSPQPMAQILLNSFGKSGFLAVWALLIVVQYMMGVDMLLITSRQTFAFSRDRALPFSEWLYRLDRHTASPVNSVLFDVVVALSLGLLVFAGDQAIDAVFTLAVTGIFVSFIIPITARYLGSNDFKPGPFSLGIYSFAVSAVAVLFMFLLSVVFMFPASPRPSPAEMNYSSVVFGGVLLFSLVWYYFPNYGGVNWFTGPVSNVGSDTAHGVGCESEVPIMEPTSPDV